MSYGLHYSALSYFSSPSINMSVGIRIKIHVSLQHALVLATYSLHDFLHSFTMDCILSDIN